MTRLRWSGSNEAQRQADAAFAKLRPKKKPAAKKRRSKKTRAFQRRWVQEQSEPIDPISVQFRAIMANS
jgi:hypothetical protein